MFAGIEASTYTSCHESQKQNATLGTLDLGHTIAKSGLCLFRLAWGIYGSRLVRDSRSSQAILVLWTKSVGLNSDSFSIPLDQSPRVGEQLSEGIENHVFFQPTASRQVE